MVRPRKVARRRRRFPNIACRSCVRRTRLLRAGPRHRGDRAPVPHSEIAEIGLWPKGIFVSRCAPKGLLSIGRARAMPKPHRGRKQERRTNFACESHSHPSQTTTGFPRQVFGYAALPRMNMGTTTRGCMGTRATAELTILDTARTGRAHPLGSVSGQSGRNMLGVRLSARAKPALPIVLKGKILNQRIGCA
jgi:hypothetical protein